MTKIDIFSGFLGAGKTTLIKKLLSDVYANEKIVLIENEFGEIGIDSGFLKDAGIEITEMNSGCICCSLVGDFAEALGKVISELAPDRILIEPSGVGKLSDVIKAVASVDGTEICNTIAVVDATKAKIYRKNFGEFFCDQISNAKTVFLSRTGSISEEKLDTAIEIVRELNADATLVTTPWDELSADAVRSAIESGAHISNLLSEAEEEAHEHHHHHHDDEECCCGHHHHEHEHEHHHDEECSCGHHHEHHHHHHDGEECCCGHHHHDHDHDHEHHHHHHHHADDVFDSWGIETAKKFSFEKIKAALCALENSEKYGAVLRAKGLVAGEDGKWIYFDYVPEESNVRYGAADVTGRLCVIGSGLDKEAIEQLFIGG